eukprot:jgi/Galph1/1190/GphlegSOOS_G5972.1
MPNKEEEPRFGEGAFRDKITVSVDIPKRLHGKIVGQHGDTLKELSDRTRADIRVPPADATDTTIVITGEPLAVASARKRILTIAGHDATVGEQYRALAEEASKQRDQYFQTATALYQKGEKQQAKHLSELGHMQDDKIHHFNTVAEEQIYRERNDLLGSNEIDLHFLHVNEALSRLESKLVECRDDTLKVITGAGHHSDHGPVLKRAVKEYLEKNRLPYKEDGDGAFLVSLAKQLPSERSHIPQPSLLERILHRLCCCFTG